MPAPPGSPLVVVSAAVVLSGRPRPPHPAQAAGRTSPGRGSSPGGKVEPDEDPRAALARELGEEIGVTAEVGDIVEVTFHRYPAKNVLLLFYETRLAPGSPDPIAIDVAAVRWAEAAELRDEDFPPADVAVLAKVRGGAGSAGRPAA